MGWVANGILDLMQNNEYILLLGKSLAACQTHAAREQLHCLKQLYALIRLSIVDFIKTYTRLLADVCSRVPERVRRDVQLPWLCVLDSFLTLARSNPPDLDPFTVNYDDRIIVWQELGMRCGIEESAVRQEAATILRRTRPDGSPGCSWLRCPLYGDSGAMMEREIMICSQCRLVSCARSRHFVPPCLPNFIGAIL